MRPIRWLPWAVSLLAAFLALGMGTSSSGSGEGAFREAGRLSAVPSPDPVEILPCGELYGLSAQAAALTGSLALVGLEERPARARWAAEEVHGLAAQAVGIEGGEELSRVLEDLADALEGYVRGDPRALAAVREASARNAALRASYFELRTLNFEPTTENGGEQ